MLRKLLTLKIRNSNMKIPTLDCKRCNHAWYPRAQKKPVLCPKCKSPYWNRDRKNQVRTIVTHAHALKK